MLMTCWMVEAKPAATRVAGMRTVAAGAAAADATKLVQFPKLEVQLNAAS